MCQINSTFGPDAILRIAPDQYTNALRLRQFEILPQSSAFFLHVFMVFSDR